MNDIPVSQFLTVPELVNEISFELGQIHCYHVLSHLIFIIVYTEDS